MRKKYTIESLQKLVDQFVTERDWQQFHSPKNTAINLSVEASELLEIFIWVNERDSLSHVQLHKQAVEDEVGDTLIALLAFCTAANIDLGKAIIQKLEKTKKKYPADDANVTQRVKYPLERVK